MDFDKVIFNQASNSHLKLNILLLETGSAVQKIIDSNFNQYLFRSLIFSRKLTCPNKSFKGRTLNAGYYFRFKTGPCEVVETLKCFWPLF
jgi:hypothetical protein